MLAYVLWHRPATGVDGAEYELAQGAFHHALEAEPWPGLRAARAYRAAAFPWLSGTAYEDWYLLEGYGELGAFAQQPMSDGHRAAHDAAAHGYGSGAGALYALLEGDPATATNGDAGFASWLTRPRGAPPPALAELAGEGPGASLWRRELVLGPAPEYCLLSPRQPAVVPQAWTSTTVLREPL